MAPRPEVAVFTESRDWHTQRLRHALRALGAEPLFLSLADCGFTLGTGGALVTLPGFGGRLPTGALVRMIPAGSFEQVTLRLSVLHALARLGVPVYNDAGGIERCVDKAMTSFLVARAGLPTPPTWAAGSLDRAREIVRAETRPGQPLVLKPLFGSQGRGLRLVGAADELPPPDAVGGVYYLQRFLGSLAGGWRDWRAFVIGGRAVAAMIRHGGADWRTNACRGARCEAVPPQGAVAELAVAAAAAVGAAYAGVDIIAGREGELLVLEVNSMPAWKALQRVAPEVDIARTLAADFLARRPAPAWPVGPERAAPVLVGA